MNKYIQFYIGTLLLILFASCETIVEVGLPDNKIQAETVFEDINTARSVLAGAYTNLRDQSLLSGERNSVGYLLSLYTDELAISYDPQGTSVIFDIHNNTLLPINDRVQSIWTSSYSHIYVINSLILGLEHSEKLPVSEKSSLLGESYLLRSLYYYYLTNLFGDIPLVTTLDYQINTKIKKTKHIDVLKFVEEDLLKSLELLKYEYRNAERVFPNKAVVELMLAKTYLLMNRNEEAATVSKKVIDNPLYLFEPDLKKVFKKTSLGTLWQYNLNNNRGATGEALNYTWFTLPPSSAMMTESLLSSFSATDSRKIEWVKTDKLNGQSWSHPHKYKNADRNSVNPDENSILFRIEEAYFIYAEALANLDRVSDAIPFINKTRQRAGLQLLPTDLTKEEFVGEMLEEAKREFFTEHGHRFFDLKRNNKLNILEKTKPNWEAKHALFPYPEKEILLNPNLLPNNEGY
ncbi:RagB/SusD family nutrient uptake outer membrane protein [Sphingobacterium faecale]|uniref:RagB/SusD family nutrient uptake outer membrane protein n=1 Tax=Sphingobacterium faecale TaxID=2803775 RepID=A0ABS1R9M1_9SPHI|nr:RagB/SusD family nutrient uptake outer membrane protein [Sphingobacterium faecale]MBL1410995.1 RagB/SusD family nutrient uptake outer membrane protein [Sphingobacterium faecale]